MAQGYVRLYRRIWNDEKFKTLSWSEKLVALNLLTSQSNRIGLFHVSLASVAVDTGIKAPAAAKWVVSSCAKLGWGWDPKASVVFIPSWWRYNSPDNPKALRGSLSDLEDVPRNSLMPLFCSEMDRVVPKWREALTSRSRYHVDTIGDGMGMVSLPKPYPEPKPEPDPEPEKATPSLNEVEDRSGLLRDWKSEFHESFWPQYPRKVSKDGALKAWSGLLGVLDREGAEALAESVSRGLDWYKRKEWLGRPADKIPHPDTWLNQKRWEDCPDGTRQKT